MLFSKATRKATGRLGIGPHKFLAPSPCSVHWQWWLCADELPLHSAEQSTCYLGWMQLIQWLMKKKKFCGDCRGFKKCSHLRICDGYFLGNVNVAVQDTPELSFGTTHSEWPVFSLEQGGMGWGMLALLHGIWKCNQQREKTYISCEPVLAP